MANRVATQPMPASQRKLGSLKMASRLKGFELGSVGAADACPLREVDEEDEVPSSSALRSFDGARLIGFVVESRLLSAPAEPTTGVDVCVDDWTRN